MSTREPAVPRWAVRTAPRRRRWPRRVLGGVLLLLLLGVGTFLVLYATVSIPDPNATALAQANVYQTADGKVIARTGQVNREKVALSRVPLTVQHAFVAAENKTFYTDRGVDVPGTLRALFNTVTGRGLQGGSTITQQYVKNYYLDQDQSLTRKAKELIIALKVDREESKTQILDGYLNTCYFGRGAYGIQAAAQAYYHEDVSRLTVGQGAYLATLVQAPSEYDLATANAAARKLAVARWHYVLNNMVQMHWLTPAQRTATRLPYPDRPSPSPGLSGQAGYFVDLADTELENEHVLTAQQLAAGGWTITLTIDPARQNDLMNAVHDELTSHLDTRQRPKDANAQLGAASVDPRTGHVVALYGGAGYPQHYVANDTRADYQVASTFKPVEFAAALQNHATTQSGQPITAGTVYNGDSGRPVVGSPVPFAPTNEDGVSYGNITVSQAMDDSVNAVFAQLAVDVGLNRVADTAVALGMPSQAPGLRDGPSIALGTVDASPLTMAGIYATFDNHGRKVTPTIVASVTHAGQHVALPDPIGGQAVSRATADAVTAVLTGVVDSGTGTAARQSSQVAGKTGTSDNDISAWFTGYTPELVTSVGMFGQDAANGNQVPLTGTGGVSGGRVNGGGYPAQVWGAYTRAALSGHPPQRFDLQAGSGAVVLPPAATASGAGSAPPTASAPPGAGPSGQPSGPATPPGPPVDTGQPVPPVSTDPTPPDGGPGGPGGPGGGRTSTPLPQRSPGP